MAETFLIIGASSFYGKNFAEYVRAQGDEVIEMSMRKWWPRDLRVHEPEYVVNFAAANIVADSWDSPTCYMHINACIHTDIVQVLRGQKWLKRYIHVSTPEVYGHMERWSDESHPFNPSTPYAVSRAATDMLLMAYYRAYGFPAIITRTANIYGPGQPEHRVIPHAFRTLLNGGHLLLHGGGKTVRSFIHVRDACAATYRIAKAGRNGQTYHISTERAVSIFELVTLIAKQLGARAKGHIGEQADRIGKDPAYLLLSNKLRSLGWADTTTLEQGLEEWAVKSTS